MGLRWKREVGNRIATMLITRNLLLILKRYRENSRSAGYDQSEDPFNRLPALLDFREMAENSGLGIQASPIPKGVFDV